MDGWSTGVVGEGVTDRTVGVDGSQSESSPISPRRGRGVDCPSNISTERAFSPTVPINGWVVDRWVSSPETGLSNFVVPFRRKWRAIPVTEGRRTSEDPRPRNFYGSGDQEISPEQLVRRYSATSRHLSRDRCRNPPDPISGRGHNDTLGPVQ